MSSLQQKLENWRLRQHFKRVETILRNRDVSHVPPNLQQARKQYLDHLHNYAARGIFPRNYEQLPYSPCFIDRDGRECAVAHLVMVAGQTELADEIAAAANYAYVPQMAFPEFETWAAQSGFTKEELALIQPGYWMEFDSSVLSTAIQIWAIGLGILLINAIQVARRRVGIIMPSIGIIITIILLPVGVSYLFEAMVAYNVAMHSDGWPNDLPVQDVAPLRLLGLITLSLVLLTGSLSFYRTRAYIQSQPKRKGRYQPSPKES